MSVSSNSAAFTIPTATSGNFLTCPIVQSAGGTLVFNNADCDRLRQNNFNVALPHSSDPEQDAIAAHLLAGESANAALPDLQNDSEGCAKDNLDAAGKDDKVAILKCFSVAVKNLRITAALQANKEFLKWQHNPYTYTPPPGFEYDAPIKGYVGGHATEESSVFSSISDPVAAPDVRAFGWARAITIFLGGNGGQEISNSTIKALALAQSTDQATISTALGGAADTSDEADAERGSQYVGGLAAGFSAGKLIVQDASVFGKIWPYAGRFFVNGARGLEVAEASTGIGVVAAFLTVMAEAGYDEGKKVIGNHFLPGDLVDEVKAAQAAQQPQLSDLVQTQEGRSQLFVVYMGGVRHLPL